MDHLSAPLCTKYIGIGTDIWILLVMICHDSLASLSLSLSLSYYPPLHRHSWSPSHNLHCKCIYLQPWALATKSWYVMVAFNKYKHTRFVFLMLSAVLWASRQSLFGSNYFLSQRFLLGFPKTESPTDGNTDEPKCAKTPFEKVMGMKFRKLFWWKQNVGCRPFVVSTSWCQIDLENFGPAKAFTFLLTRERAINPDWSCLSTGCETGHLVDGPLDTAKL